MKDETNPSESHPSRPLTALAPTTTDSTRRRSRQSSRNNPFSIPSVANLLAGREDEKLRIQEKREVIRSMTLAERADQLRPPVPDYLSRSSQRTPTSSALAVAINDDSMSNCDSASSGDVSMTAAASRKEGRRRISEFIQQKREVYLVQMLMDRKNHEIQRLNNKIFNDESCLDEQETKIEASSAAYKMQNAKVESDLAKARKQMEAAVRMRVEATKSLRLFTQQVAAIKSDISKNEDALESYREYLDFLKEITPDGENVHTYFKNPKDLLDLLEIIEKENLFIFQQSQILVDMENRGKSTVDHDIQNTDDLILQAKSELSRIDNIVPIETETKGTELLDEQLLHLQRLVEAMYLHCYRKESNVSTMVMLEKVENDLEMMYRKITTIDNTFVSEKQAVIDKKRREQLRREKQERQLQEQKLKTEQALMRATKPIKKKTGRPLYRRNVPVKVKRTSDAKKLAMRKEQQRIETLLYGPVYQ